MSVTASGAGVLFAFSPDRQAILLATDNKSDVSEKRLYRQFQG